MFTVAIYKESHYIYGLNAKFRSTDSTEMLTVFRGMGEIYQIFVTRIEIPESEIINSSDKFHNESKFNDKMHARVLNPDECGAQGLPDLPLRLFLRALWDPRLRTTRHDFIFNRRITQVLRILIYYFHNYFSTYI